MRSMRDETRDREDKRNSLLQLLLLLFIWTRKEQWK